MSADRILEDFSKTVTDRPLGLGVGDEFLVFLALLDELGLRVPNSVAIALYVFRMRVPAGVIGEGRRIASRRMRPQTPLFRRLSRPSPERSRSAYTSVSAGMRLAISQTDG